MTCTLTKHWCLGKSTKYTYNFSHFHCRHSSVSLLRLHQPESQPAVQRKNQSSTYRVYLDVQDLDLDGKVAKDFPRTVDLSLSVYEVDEGQRAGPPRALCESFLIQSWTVNVPTDAGRRGDPRLVSFCPITIVSFKNPKIINIEMVSTQIV